MPRDTQYNSSELPNGTPLLRNQYCIKRRLVDGGFGITYLALDSLDRRFVIKECYPCGISCRDFNQVQPSSSEFSDLFSSLLDQFQCEARRLAALSHPNIVGIHQIFEENGTAYMAMEFVDGIDLTTIADTDPDRFKSELVESILSQALDAIQYVHDQGILHRDIAPDNLLLDSDNHLTLIDFGSAFDAQGDRAATCSKLLAVKDGFSPHEFYADDKAQDPSSDLYALGATIYYLITGTPPPDGQERFAAISAGDPDPYQCLSGGGWTFSPSLLASVDRALEVLQKDRISSADEWLAQLNNETDTASDSEAAEPVVATEIPKDAIIRLVSDTNKAITPGLSATQCKQKTERGQGEAREKPSASKKLWVDIFGNPIRDVELFLREQDGHTRAGSPGHARNGASFNSSLVVQIPPPRTSAAPGKLRRSIIGKLLGRRGTSKKDLPSSATV